MKFIITKIFAIMLVFTSFVAPMNQEVLMNQANSNAQYDIQSNAVSAESVQTADHQTLVEMMTIKEENSDWDYTQFYQILNVIPNEVLSGFINQKWSLSFGDVKINSYYESSGIKTIGLTYPKSHHIYVSVYTSIPHEMGHYVAVNNPDIQNQKDVLYENEASNAHGFLTKYECTYSADEYVAGYAAYLFNHMDNVDALGALKRATPNTYKLFEQVIANGWIPAVAE